MSLLPRHLQAAHLPIDPTLYTYLLMIEMELLQQEVMRTMLFNTKNHVIASPVIYQGSCWHISSTV